MKTICIVGLGYVGLPLALECAKHFPVLGIDVNNKRVEELERGIDKNKEHTNEEITKAGITFSSDVSNIAKADIIVIAVPTPINKNREPDLTYIKKATQTVAQNMSKGATIIFESTVYPGVTQEVCLPIIRQETEFEVEKDFFLGYSPERINPGDKERSISTITKIVSGHGEGSLKIISEFYEKVISAGIHKASSIKVAEAAKVLENTQRDLNIALMNEMAIILDKLDVSTNDVIEAAATKWNFHKYTPGLVGGHCISVDPHYLLYKAQQVGYHPKVILAGREVNEYIPEFITTRVIKKLNKQGKLPAKTKALMLGITFKENVKDTRNSKAFEIIKQLKEYDIEVSCFDPLFEENEIRQLQQRPKSEGETYDVIILAVAHDKIKQMSKEQLLALTKETSIIFDVKGIVPKEIKSIKGIEYERL